MKEIVVVDIETTGFQGQGGLIVEVGIVALDLDTGGITNLFDSLVQEPELDETHTEGKYGWIFKNSSLKYSDVLKAPLLSEVIPEIQDIFDKYENGATAYNKRFDFGFLNARGIKIKELPCIMIAATPICNIPNRWNTGPKWPTVEEAWAFFFPSHPYIEEHRALDDARHEALILLEMYNRQNS